MKENIKEEVIEAVADNVKRLHKYKPKYVFLTETSAIPNGYAFKEAWKNAYGNEQLPIFYRIDPKALMLMSELKDKVGSFGGELNGENQSVRRLGNLLEEHKLKLETFLKARIRDKNGSIFIYDEDPLHGQSPKIVYDLLTNPESFGLSGDLRCHNVHRVRGSNEFPDNASEQFTRKVLRPNVTSKEDYSQSFPFDKLVLRGKIKRDDRKRSIDAISYFKKVGELAGERLRQEQGKRKSLEHALTPTIAIGSLATSFLFISSNITGNTITDLSVKTSSYIGIILFAIALISGFFWLKNRKKISAPSPAPK